MNEKNRKAVTMGAVALMAVMAMVAVVPLMADGSSADTDYGSATNISIAPGMRYTYTPTWPSDLTVSTTLQLQKQGSLTGTDVSIASVSGNTLTVNIPKSASVGTQYHVVLKCVSSNPAQQTYIYIVFNTVANLAVSGTQSNVVEDTAFTFTPHATGMGTFTWTVTSGSSLPTGLTLNASTGKVTGKIADPGDYTIKLTCTSSYGEVKDLVVNFHVTTKIAPTNSPSNGVIVYVI